MAKIDIAREIVEKFPDKGLDAENLSNSLTEKELNNFRLSLEEEDNAKSLEVEPEEEIEVEPKGKYKLANPKTQYAENYPEGSFTLAVDQEKELPEFPSSHLIERIRSGFIVRV